MGGRGSGLGGTCLRYVSEVASWDAAAELLLPALSWAAESI